MTDTRGPQTQIMDLALNTYLGTEDTWCKDAYARNAEGRATHSGHKEAVAHCAEGALTAAAYRLRFLGEVSWDWEKITDVFQGVERQLFEQNPEFVEKVCLGNEDFRPGTGRYLPAFNDGMRFFDGSAIVPSVGYQGIRAAFEKYLSICEEKGL